MSSVQEIENAIRILPPREQDDLFLRLEEQYGERFDARIERDIESGALDKLIDEALLDYEAGRVRDL